MVRLEPTYLHEVGRIADTAERILAELGASAGLAEDPQPFSRVIDVAERMNFTRDPFDRLIVAQAIVAKVPLVTKDERIREACPQEAVWD